MKRFHILLAALLFAAGAAAQNPTAYFMEGSTLRMQFNPAFAPHRGYVNVPGAGGADFGLNSSLALDDILYPRDGQLATLLDPSVTTAEALRNIHDRNTLHAGGRVNLLGFGGYTVNRKHFWSFGIDLRVDAAANIPGKLLEFMKRGTDGAIRGLALNFDTYVDAGFSYSFPLLNDRLYIGAKAKFVMGLARMRMAVERMDVTLHDDRWAVDARTALDANIPGTRVDYRYDDDGRPYFGIGDIEPFANGFKPAGYGFAADLGATYDVLDELQVSLSVTDLGFIGWNRESSVRGHSETSAEYTGIVVENDEVSMSPDFSFDELTRFRPDDPEAGVRMLQATLNAGAEYFVWNHRVGFGLLYRMQFFHFATLHSVTGSVNFSPVKWFTLTGSYTRTSRCGGSFGLGLNLCPGWIHFFVATDLATAKYSPQYIPVNRRTVDVTFGLGFPLGPRGCRMASRNAVWK